MRRLSKTKWCLFGCLIIVFVFVAGSVFVPNGLTNAVRWVADNDFASKLRALPKQEEIQEDTLIEMVVESIRVSKINYQPVLILKEKGGDLYLPIGIGLIEADAISVVLEGVELPRPLTPDLLCSIIDRIGASVDYIVIDDLQNQTFYANVALHANWMQMDIDARPSDAIAIALRVKAPIYATKSVLEKAGVLPDREPDRYITLHVEKDKSGTTS